MRITTVAPRSARLGIVVITTQLLLVSAASAQSSHSLPAGEPADAAPATAQTTPSPVTAPAPAASPATAPDVLNALAEVQRQADRTDKRLDTYTTAGTILSLSVSVVLAILGFFGYSTLRKWIKAYVRQHLDATVTAELHRTLPTVLENLQRQAEDHLLRLAKLLALRSSKHYDEALDEYGWDGNVVALRSQSPILRRAIIECLHSALRRRDKNRTAAWEAAYELTRDDSSLETDKLFLRLAISYRKYTDGIAHFERRRAEVLSTTESALLAATLLRRTGRSADALAIARGCDPGQDANAVVTIASLQRDLGHFNEAHDSLLARVNRLMAEHFADLPSGWHRLFNTFIANCIDRGHPDDALRAADFLIKNAPGPVETFTAGRLALATKPGTPGRDELLQQFREATGRLPDCEARTRCQVTLLEIEGRTSEALALLQAAIDGAPSTAGESMRPDVYYLICTTGAILAQRGQPAQAIDALMPAVSVRMGGEAPYRLAVAYAMQGKGVEAARWLRQALQEAPKWAALARDDERLRASSEVIDELAKHASP